MVEMALVLPILLVPRAGDRRLRPRDQLLERRQPAGGGRRPLRGCRQEPGRGHRQPGDNDFRHWIRIQADTDELHDGTRRRRRSRRHKPSESTTGRWRVCVGKPGQRRTLAEGDLTVGKPIEVVVETSYNLIPFLGERTQIGQVKIRGTAVMRLEQDYTMARAARHEAAARSTCAGAPATSGGPR